MEEYKTKNKILNLIIEPVIKKLENEKYTTNPISFNDLPNKLLRIRKEFKTKIFSPKLDLFIDFDKEIKRNGKPKPIEWKQYIEKLFNALQDLDNFNIKLINEKITDLKTDFNNLTFSILPEYLKSWFQKFCVNIKSLFTLLSKRAKEVESKELSDNIFLYIIQLSTCVKILFQTFNLELENKIVISESRSFLKKRFIYIFDGIIKDISAEFYTNSNIGFIQWMDNALDLLSLLDPTNNENDIEALKSAVDEVLCHAMSIVQISSAEDSKRIKAGVQSVLNEFKQLKVEFEKTALNPSSCNLSLDLVSDKLCLLEQRVNTAVLNISLKVFSNPFTPLNKLQKICEDSENSIMGRTENDLDDLITNFDSHVDCIIQIGLFAIACSTNTSIVSAIRSSLASLENLESEIIPALTSLYMEPSKDNCLYVQILANHWYDEIKSIRENVCFIIDPIAFGQVVHEDYKKQIENLQETINKNVIDQMRKNVKVFILVINASIKDMKLNKDSEIVKHVKNLKHVHNEVTSAINLLPEDDKKYKERIMKRILILSTMIGRVISAFAGENKNKTTILKESSNVIKSDIFDKIEPIKLKQLQIRGIEILKETSILYKTPVKLKLMPFTTPKTIKKSIKRPEVRKLGISFVRKQILTNCDNKETENNSTMDLNITDILEDLTNFADTLKSYYYK